MACSSRPMEHPVPGHTGRAAIDQRGHRSDPDSIRGAGRCAGADPTRRSARPDSALRDAGDRRLVTGATVRAWGVRPFRTYWLGQTVSEIGDRVTELALPLTAVLVLDAGPLAVGALTAAVWAPYL